MTAKTLKKGFIWLFAGCILSISSGLPVRTALSGENNPNLIRNPGFEECDKENRPSGWSWYNNMGKAPSDKTCFTGDKETYAVLPIGGGGNAAKMAISDDFEYSRSSGFLQRGIQVEGNTSYLLSFRYIQSLNVPANIYAAVSQYDADKKPSAGKPLTYIATNIPPSETWNTFSKEFKTAPNTATMDLIIWPNGQGTSWFDDFSLTKVE